METIEQIKETYSNMKENGAKPAALGVYLGKAMLAADAQFPFATTALNPNAAEYLKKRKLWEAKQKKDYLLWVSKQLTFLGIEDNGLAEEVKTEIKSLESVISEGVGNEAFTIGAYDIYD